MTKTVPEPPAWPPAPCDAARPYCGVAGRSVQPARWHLTEAPALRRNWPGSIREKNRGLAAPPARPGFEQIQPFWFQIRCRKREDIEMVENEDFIHRIRFGDAFKPACGKFRIMSIRLLQAAVDAFKLDVAWLVKLRKVSPFQPGSSKIFRQRIQLALC